MTKIFSNKLFSRVTCLVLAAIFLSSFPAGASALALCLDEAENHLVGQNLYLIDCHTSVEVVLLLSEEHCIARAEKENNDCTDVSLTNANTLNLPSKIILPAFAKMILPYILPSRVIGSQQKVAGYNSSALSHPLFPSSLLNAHRTVVLLI